MKHLLLILAVLLQATPIWSNSIQTKRSCLIETCDITLQKHNEELNHNKESQNSENDVKQMQNKLYINVYSVAALLISLVSSIISIKAKNKSDKILEKIQMKDLRLRTSNIVLSKRLEVFPKLHIHTDKLGATIRYYYKHPNTSELKKGLQGFYKQLSDWDAKYCIFSGIEVTSCISHLRKKLEEEESWRDDKDTSFISDDDIKGVYRDLQNLEAALKKEMAVFFTSFEDENNIKEEYIDSVK